MEMYLAFVFYFYTLEFNYQWKTFLFLSMRFAVNVPGRMGIRSLQSDTVLFFLNPF